MPPTATCPTETTFRLGDYLGLLLTSVTAYVKTQDLRR
jgi:hypothetical protein